MRRDGSWGCEGVSDVVVAGAVRAPSLRMRGVCFWRMIRVRYALKQVIWDDSVSSRACCGVGRYLPPTSGQAIGDFDP